MAIDKDEVSRLAAHIDPSRFMTSTQDRAFADKSPPAAVDPNLQDDVSELLRMLRDVKISQCPNSVGKMKPCQNVIKLCAAINRVVLKLMDAWSMGQYRPNRATRESYNSEGRGVLDVLRAIRCMLSGYLLYNDFYRVRDRNPVNDRDARIIIDCTGLTSDAAVIAVAVVLEAFFRTNDHGRTDVVLCCGEHVCKIVDSTKDFDVDPAAVLQSVLVHVGLCVGRSGVSSALYPEVTRNMRGAFQKKDIIVLSPAMFDDVETGAIAEIMKKATEAQISVVAIGLGLSPVRLPVVFPVSAYGSSGPALARAFRSPPFTIYGEDMSDASKLCHSYTVDEDDMFYRHADPKKAPDTITKKRFENIVTQIDEYAAAVEQTRDGDGHIVGFRQQRMQVLVFFGYLFDEADRPDAPDTRERYIVYDNFKNNTAADLEVAGIGVTSVFDYESGIKHLSSGAYDVALIICGPGDGKLCNRAANGAKPEHIATFTEASAMFRERGGFLQYCCDNRPFCFEFIQFLHLMRGTEPFPLFKADKSHEIDEFFLAESHGGGKAVTVVTETGEKISTNEGDSIAISHPDLHENFHTLATNSQHDPMAFIYHVDKPGDCGDFVTPFGLELGSTKLFKDREEGSNVPAYVRALLFRARSLLNMYIIRRPSKFDVDMPETPEKFEFKQREQVPVNVTVPIPQRPITYLIALDGSGSMKNTDGGNTTRFADAVGGLKDIFTKEIVNGPAGSKLAVFLFNHRADQSKFITGTTDNPFIYKDSVFPEPVLPGSGTSFNLAFNALNARMVQEKERQSGQKPYFITYLICDGATGDSDEVIANSNSILNKWRDDPQVRTVLLLFKGDNVASKMRDDQCAEIRREAGIKEKDNHEVVGFERRQMMVSIGMTD